MFFRDKKQVLSLVFDNFFAEPPLAHTYRGSWFETSLRATCVVESKLFTHFFSKTLRGFPCFTSKVSTWSILCVFPWNWIEFFHYFLLFWLFDMLCWIVFSGWLQLQQGTWFFLSWLCKKRQRLISNLACCLPENLCQKLLSKSPRSKLRSLKTYLVKNYPPSLSVLLN